MNRKAVIENCDYHLLETIPSLTGQEKFIVCKDTDGNKFVCPEDFWLHYAPKLEATAPVHAGSTSQEKIDFFLSLFRRRDNLYARCYYNLKTGKSGYVPACIPTLERMYHKRLKGYSELGHQIKHPNKILMPAKSMMGKII